MEDVELECELLGAMFDECELAWRGASRTVAVRLAPANTGQLRPLWATVELELPPLYPEEHPLVRLSAARGTVEREEREVVAAARAARGALGERCCIDVVQAALEALTRIAERPSECACCYELIDPLDSFRAPCEHCFHAVCVLRWRQACGDAEPPRAADGAGAPSGGDARLRAAVADHAQAAARIEAHGAHETAVRDALSHAERQLAALEPADRQHAASLDRLVRQHRDTLSDVRREGERLRRAEARLHARLSTETDTAEQAAAERSLALAERALPCPVCRLPIGARELDALQREHPPPARGPASRARHLSIDELLDSELLARVRALQAEHVRLAHAQLARADAVATGGDRAASPARSKVPRSSFGQ
ncbi:hypothetical protein KFE25_000407 [Diacronema lutheri]|uniref:RWD domain-containing protein n=1 Tax=Diacronema lutheri TaxID=2081491 RepID=A0A8J6CDH5_DIALT|nr:hypothetical protein KFE25_000407 [Diacronema lutheri]